MMFTEMSRLSILTSLVELNLPLPELAAAVRTLSWDWDGDPVVILKRAHVAAVLRRFESGGIEASDVEAWANLVECREDIEFEPQHEAALADAIFDLANPELQGPLRAVAPQLLAKLER